MKKQILTLLTGMFLVGTSFAHADKKLDKANKANAEMMTIIDKGVKRTVPVNALEKKDSLQKSTSKTKHQKGLLVRFSKGAEVNIEDFEKKYDLKLKQKMQIGYYIFKNKSKESDLTVMNRIIENEKDIDSIKPNWKKNNSPR